MQSCAVLSDRNLVFVVEGSSMILNISVFLSVIAFLPHFKNNYRKRGKARQLYCRIQSYQLITVKNG